MTDKTETNERAGENPLFLGLIGNLQVSAVIHLGKMADPVSGETKRNLPAAKASIDLLRMLREKTKGNLTDGERNFLDNAVFELEISYVEESGKEEQKPESEDTLAKDARDDEPPGQPDREPG
jgi:hypothetical protein